MFWMTAYFSVGAWSGILMMHAPGLHVSEVRRPLPIQVFGHSIEEKLLPAVNSCVNCPVGCWEGDCDSLNRIPA